MKKKGSCHVLFLRFCFSLTVLSIAVGGYVYHMNIGYVEKDHLYKYFIVSAVLFLFISTLPSFFLFLKKINQHKIFKWPFRIVTFTVVSFVLYHLLGMYWFETLPFYAGDIKISNSLKIYWKLKYYIAPIAVFWALMITIYKVIGYITRKEKNSDQSE